MALRDFLSENKSDIFERWFDSFLASYPADATGFFKQRQQTRQFANPVGYTSSRAMEGILDGLIEDKAIEELTPFIEDIVRIRAIQDLTPSQALVFLFHLKNLVRDVLGPSGQTMTDDLHELDSRIDALALRFFDIYMKCREKVFELKANEVKNRTYRLLQMANLVGEVQE